LGRRPNWGNAIDGILVIDKDTGCVSSTVTRQLKKHLFANRVGHIGTLDPFATGVLPICFGRACKTIATLEQKHKTYIATVQFGSETDSCDHTGKVVKTSDYRHISQKQILQTIPQFIGTIWQTPPIYSAIKVGGKPMYQYARRGQAVTARPRQVTVEAITLLQADNLPHQATFEVVCQRGTYIRSLFRDLARSLNSSGHLTALRRTASSGFDVNSSEVMKLDEVLALTQEQARQKLGTIETTDEHGLIDN